MQLILLLVMGVVSCVIAAQGVALVLVAAADVPTSEAGRVLQAPGSLALMTAVQYTAMVVVAIAMCRIALRRPREALALGSPGPVPLVAGALAGLATLGVASGLGALLLEAFPSWDVGALEDFGEAFTAGPLGPRLALALVVAVGAPIAEELVFRGVLWDLLRRKLSARAVFIITSIAFAAWHIRPFHVLTLVPTAFLFGWLRYRTGSVLPSIVAHAVNNGLGAALLVSVGADTEADLQIGPFLVASAMYVAAVALAARVPADPSARPP